MGLFPVSTIWLLQYSFPLRRSFRIWSLNVNNRLTSRGTRHNPKRNEQIPSRSRDIQIFAPERGLPKMSDPLTMELQRSFYKVGPITPHISECRQTIWRNTVPPTVWRNTVPPTVWRFSDLISLWQQNPCLSEGRSSILYLLMRNASSCNCRPPWASIYHKSHPHGSPNDNWRAKYRLLEQIYYGNPL